MVTDSPAICSPEAVAQQIAWVREAAGVRVAQIELSIVARFTVTDQPEQEAETMARERGWTGPSAADVLAMPSVLIGSMAQIAEAMQARGARFGFSYDVVTDGQMDTVARREVGGDVSVHCSGTSKTAGGLLYAVWLRQRQRT